MTLERSDSLSWPSEQSCNFPLTVYVESCTVLFLPAHLPESLTVLRHEAPWLPSAPFISAHHYRRDFQEAVQSPGKGKDERPTCLSWRGLEDWVDRGRTFPPADEVWSKDPLLTGFYQ